MQKNTGEMQEDIGSKEFALCLARQRVRRNISARQMSKDLGQNDNYIANIENNISGPSLPMLVKICKYFDISIDEFLGYRTVNSPILYEAINGLKDLDASDLEPIAAIIKRLRKE